MKTFNYEICSAAAGCKARRRNMKRTALSRHCI